MNRSVLIALLFAVLSIPTIGCGPSASDLERERIGRQQAEDAKIAAEQRAESERQRREEEAANHESEKSRLWMYVFGVGVVAVILLFFGTAIGSAARTDAEKTEGFNDG